MVQSAVLAGGVGAVNFGVAIDQAAPVIRQLLERGSVQRAAIGMTIVTVDALAAQREAEATGTPLLPRGGAYTSGLLVTFAPPGKPASMAGLREGDVLLEVNGRKLTRKGDYFAELGPVFVPGKTLACTVWRPAAPVAGGSPLQPAVRRGTRGASAEPGGDGGEMLKMTIVPTVRNEVAPSTWRVWHWRSG